MKAILTMLAIHVFRCSVRGFRLAPVLNRFARPTLHSSPVREMARSFAALPIENLVTATADSLSSSNLTEQPVSLKSSKRGRKVRQHVNPLASGYMKPLQLESDWMYKEFEKIGPGEFIIDIGCARGSWAMDMCRRDPNINVVGLEIRIPIIELCLKRKQDNNIRNAHFFKSNANVDIDNIFESLIAKGINVNTVTIQFPDPHFKARNKKKRVVNANLVRSLARHLAPGMRVFLQTDIEELGYDMVSHFASSEFFSPVDNYNALELHNNVPIYEVQTEREICTLRDGKHVYRMLFVRNTILYE